MTQAPLYAFRRKGRSWSTLIALLIAWCLLLLGWAVFDAAPLLLAVLFVLSLPAAWDVYAARMAGTDLHPDRLEWFSGTRAVCVATDEIDHVRLVTRLDLSVRVAVVLTTGRKLRLPAEATPPAEPFEAALREAGLRGERHHFTFL